MALPADVGIAESRVFEPGDLICEGRAAIEFRALSRRREIIGGDSGASDIRFPAALIGVLDFTVAPSDWSALMKTPPGRSAS